MDGSGWDQRYAGGELVWKAGPNRFLVAETHSRPSRRDRVVTVDWIEGDVTTCVPPAGKFDLVIIFLPPPARRTAPSRPPTRGRRARPRGATRALHTPTQGAL